MMLLIIRIHHHYKHFILLEYFISTCSSMQERQRRDSMLFCKHRFISAIPPLFLFHQKMLCSRRFLGFQTRHFATSSKIIFSGIQPSGIPHIGNYFGALKHWVDEQNEGSWLRGFSFINRLSTLLLWNHELSCSYFYEKPYWISSKHKVYIDWIIDYPVMLLLLC